MRSADLTATARIRDAAIEQFGEHGFDVGLRSIAEAAGVSAALVIHHFGSKDALRAACDEYISEEIRSVKSESLRSADPATWCRPDGRSASNSRDHAADFFADVTVPQAARSASLDPKWWMGAGRSHLPPRRCSQADVEAVFTELLDCWVVAVRSAEHMFNRLNACSAHGQDLRVLGKR